MRIAILTNEYPPHVYGGAGVHVEYLTRELARADGGRHKVEVYCFGEQRIEDGNLTVRGVMPRCEPPGEDARLRKFFDPMLRDLEMAGLVSGADVVHCHTWYTHLAGCLVKELTGAKLVLTTHSLEPHRPWKVEQLGAGYRASTWVERTAYQNADGVVAVSRSMKEDVGSLYGVPEERIRVIYNGIDPAEYRQVENPKVLADHGIDPTQPFVLFVGRITRQKGIIHLVNAIKWIRPGVQVVLCAGAPDTPEIGREMAAAVAHAKEETENQVIWIAEMLPKEQVIALYSQAALFVCPSVYEPFGIINLEAMSCGTPVVATSVGGIREVVVPELTGLLVPIQARGETDFEPVEPERFAHDLATAINKVMGDDRLRLEMGRRSRERVEELFSWSSITRGTLQYYRELVGVRAEAGHGVTPDRGLAVEAAQSAGLRNNER